MAEIIDFMTEKYKNLMPKTALEAERYVAAEQSIILYELLDALLKEGNELAIEANKQLDEHSKWFEEKWEHLLPDCPY